jgi:hypothetical protein
LLRDVFKKAVPNLVAVKASEDASTEGLGFGAEAQFVNQGQYMYRFVLAPHQA